jgi:hypothetical protein
VQAGLEYLATVGEAIVNAVVAAWEQIVEWGSQIVNAILDAISWFVEWIWAAIEWAVNAVLSPIIAAIEGYVINVAKTLAHAWNEYERTGVVGSAAAARVAEAIFGGMFITTLMIILTVIDWVSVFIAPFGLAISAVASFLQPIIVLALSAGSGEGEMIAGLLDVGANLGEIWDVIAPHFGITGAVLALIGGLIATKAFINVVNNFWAPAWQLQTAGVIMVGAGIGMVMACFSVVVEMYPQVFGKYYKLIAAMVAVIGLIVSTFSAIASAALLVAGMAPGLLSKIGAIVSIAAVLVSICATINALQKLEEE